MLSGALLEDAVLFNATRKIANPPDKVLFLGMMAGFWVGLGGLAAVSAAGGVPEAVRSEWVSLPKFLIGTFFAFGEFQCAYFAGSFADFSRAALHCYVWRRPLYRKYHGSSDR